jgi:hypothetical protein
MVLGLLFTALDHAPPGDNATGPPQRSVAFSPATMQSAKAD